MSSHPNRSPLFTLSTHDFRNSTKAGFDVIVRADGTMRIESVNMWQGSRTGVVWIAPASPEIMRAVRGEETDDESPDVEVLIEDYLAGNWMDGARRIRLGYIVR